MGFPYGLCLGRIMAHSVSLHILYSYTARQETTNVNDFSSPHKKDHLQMSCVHKYHSWVSSTSPQKFLWMPCSFTVGQGFSTWQYLQFRPDSSLLQGCPVHCKRLSSFPGLIRCYFIYSEKTTLIN